MTQPTGRWIDPPLRALAFVAPAVVAMAAVALYATLGPVHPAGLAGLGVLALALLAMALVRAPVTVFWLVPLSMVFFVRSWVEPHDLILVGLAATGLLATRVRWRGVKLEPVEWRYLLFIGAMATTFFGPFAPRRFLAALKLASFGWLAFEVARFGARRYGRAVIAWGSLLFALLTAVMLLERGARMGIDALVTADLRGVTSELPWGRSNYVAAVLVLCLPILLFLFRAHAWDRRRHTFVLATLVAVVGGILVTTSRGGLLLTAVFLLGSGLKMRRGGWAALLGAGVLAGILLVTPLGLFLTERFTSTRGFESAIARPLGWAWAFQRGVAHLPFGVGAGQGVLQQDRLGPDDPHNYYLTLFSEGGPLSLVLWLWVLASLWQKARALSRRPETEHAGAALRGMVALAGANSLFEPTFTGSLYITLFWWMAGTFYGADSPAAATPARHVEPPFRL